MVAAEVYGEAMAATPAVWIKLLRDMVIKCSPDCRRKRLLHEKADRGVGRGPGGPPYEDGRACTGVEKEAFRAYFMFSLNQAIMRSSTSF